MLYTASLVLTSLVTRSLSLLTALILTPSPPLTPPPALKEGMFGFLVLYYSHATWITAL